MKYSKDIKQWEELGLHDEKNVRYLIMVVMAVVMIEYCENDIAVFSSNCDKTRHK